MEFLKGMCSDFLLLQERIHMRAFSQEERYKTLLQPVFTYRALILKSDGDKVKLSMVTSTVLQRCQRDFVPFLSSTPFWNSCPVPLLSYRQETLTCSTGYS